MANSEALPQIAPADLDNLLSRLESRPKPLLSHEFGVGSSCNRCNCPGLDLHFWRKICKICSCRLDEHDVRLPGDQDHGAIVTRRFFGQQFQQPTNTVSSKELSPEEEHLLVGRLRLDEGKENSQRQQETRTVDGGYGIKLIDRISPPTTTTVASFPRITSAKPPPAASANCVIYENMADLRDDGRKADEKGRGGKWSAEDWTWTPAGDWHLARRFLISLPEEERPLKGSEGAQLRRQRLARQLPDHDSDVAASKANRAEPEQQMHREFIELVKREVVGIAEVVDCAEHRAQFASKLTGNSPAELNCRQCADKFAQTDVGVVTDHERDSAEAIWHPRCFCCSVCHQLLVDLLYFYRDGKYFCGRHFGEKLYPRCAACDELIFAREYTFAEEKSWHLQHFCCFGCDRHLSGQRYVVKEDQPFCVDCYMQRFARTCSTCCNKIAPFDQRVSYGEMHWHAETRCFKCKCCAKPLSNQRFLLKGDQPFCGDECKVRFGF